MKNILFHNVVLNTNKYESDGVPSGCKGVILEVYDDMNYEIEWYDDNNNVINFFSVNIKDIIIQK